MSDSLNHSILNQNQKSKNLNQNKLPFSNRSDHNNDLNREGQNDNVD